MNRFVCPFRCFDTAENEPAKNLQKLKISKNANFEPEPRGAGPAAGGPAHERRGVGVQQAAEDAGPEPRVHPPRDRRPEDVLRPPAFVGFLKI